MDLLVEFAPEKAPGLIAFAGIAADLQDAA
jgi:hypothetical protein